MVNRFFSLKLGFLGVHRRVRQDLSGDVTADGVGMGTSKSLFEADVPDYIGVYVAIISTGLLCKSVDGQRFFLLHQSAFGLEREDGDDVQEDSFKCVIQWMG